MKTFLALLTLATGGLLLSSCSSSGYKKADTASTSLRESAHLIDRSLPTLDKVVTTLSDLVNNPAPNLTPQFEKYSDAVAKLESLAKDVASRATDMQADGAAYFKNWDKELTTIHNNDIQASSTYRKNEVAARFETVRVSYVQATVDFKPFLSDLKDIRTALATDLTAGGIASVIGLAGKAEEKAPPLRKELMQLSAEFRALGVSISPVPSTK